MAREASAHGGPLLDDASVCWQDYAAADLLVEDRPTSRAPTAALRCHLELANNGKWEREDVSLEELYPARLLLAVEERPRERVGVDGQDIRVLGCLRQRSAEFGDGGQESLALLVCQIGRVREIDWLDALLAREIPHRVRSPEVGRIDAERELLPA